MDFEAVANDMRSFAIGELDRRTLGSVVEGVRQVRGALEELEARALAALDRLDDGGNGAAWVLRSTDHCSKRESQRRIQRARALSEMPNTESGLAEGRLTVEHVDALVQAASAVSAEAVDGDAQLQGLVRARPADMAARDIRDWVARQQSTTDRDEQHRRWRAQRSLTMFEGRDGMGVAQARMDPVSFARFRALVDDEANRLYRADGGRDAGDQVRTLEQRRLDALLRLTGAAGNTPAADAGLPVTGDDANADPHADGPMMATSGAAVSNGPSLRNQLVVVATTDVISGRDPDGRCEIPGTGPIPTTELERLACDAELFGVLFSGNGLPLWHGRRLRTVSPQQWRALLARDRGCAVCGAAPSYCEAHHIVPWSPPARGPTDIENLVLVCSHHHHLVHDDRLALIRGPDGEWTLREGPRRDRQRRRRAA